MNLRSIVLGFVLPAIAGSVLALAMRCEPSAEETQSKRGVAEGDVRSLSALSKQPDPRFASHLEKLDTTDFPPLIEELGALPEHQREIAIRLALARWAQLDPQAALDYIADPEHRDLPLSTRDVVFRAWAEAGLEAALASISEENVHERARAILEVLAEDDPARACSLAAAYWEDLIWPEPEDRSRGEFCRAIFSRWMKQDLEAATDAAIEGNWYMRDAFLNLFIETRSPGKIARLASPPRDPGFVKVALYYWYEQDPALAADHARLLMSVAPFSTDPRFLTFFPEMVETLTMEQLLLLEEVSVGENYGSFFGDRLGIELDAQLRILDESPSARSNVEFINTVAAHFGKERQSEGVAWLETLPEGQQAAARLAFFAAWQEMDKGTLREYFSESAPSEELFRLGVDEGDSMVRLVRDGAFRWYDSLSPERQVTLIEENPEHVMAHDPGGVVRWSLGRLPDGQIDEIAVSGLGIWLRTEQEEALGWLREQAPETRDQFAARMEFEQNPFDFSPSTEGGIRWDGTSALIEMVEQISDPQLRGQAMRRLMASGDEDTVRVLLGNSTVSAAFRADALEVLDSRQPAEESEHPEVPDLSNPFEGL